MSTGKSEQGSTAETSSNKSKDSRGTNSINKPFESSNNASHGSGNRNEPTGIDELRGHIFTYGTQGQQSNYIRTRKALADYVGTKFKFAKELYRAINGDEEV
jgi:hypothetical protein